LNLLLDTHVLIWGAQRNPKLSIEAGALIEDPENTVWFSTISLWEIAIKNALNRPDFALNLSAFRAGLLANGYLELGLEGRHVLSLRDLPAHHRDPFDKMLVAQAQCEAAILLTADRELAKFGRGIRIV
jgi:PIN domain nuclease of toxin-antitoxin system